VLSTINSSGWKLKYPLEHPIKSGCTRNLNLFNKYLLILCSPFFPVSYLAIYLRRVSRSCCCPDRFQCNRDAHSRSSRCFRSPQPSRSHCRTAAAGVRWEAIAGVTALRGRCERERWIEGGAKATLKPQLDYGAKEGEREIACWFYRCARKNRRLFFPRITVNTFNLYYFYTLLRQLQWNWFHWQMDFKINFFPRAIYSAPRFFLEPPTRSANFVSD